MAAKDMEFFKVSPAKAGMISCLGSLSDGKGGAPMTKERYFLYLGEFEDGRFECMEQHTIAKFI